MDAKMFALLGAVIGFVGVALGAFGEVAIQPLLSFLQLEANGRAEAATTGLRALAADSREQVCAKLSETIANRFGLYSWRTQERAIVLLGTLSCTDAQPALAAYQKHLFAGLEVYRDTVTLQPSPVKANLISLEKSIKVALARLGRVQ